MKLGKLKPETETREIWSRRKAAHKNTGLSISVQQKKRTALQTRLKKLCKTALHDGMEKGERLRRLGNAEASCNQRDESLRIACFPLPSYFRLIQFERLNLSG